MIVSHERRLIVFADPLGAGDSVLRALSPWGDVEIVKERDRNSANPFFYGMTPQEAEWQFDCMGLAFRSYLRVSMTEHPFSRLTRLYDRIAQTDAIWQMRQMAGIGLPNFQSWLRNTKPDGIGAGTRNSPRWRRHGAWSAKAWEAGKIGHTVRTEAIEEDLSPVLVELGIAPSFNTAHTSMSGQDAWMDRYNTGATSMMIDRYGWDMAQFGYVAPRFRHAA
ncbi:MAG: hypothetical protein ACI91Z_000737 [Yoonia sp.]|jgi:hypothetical protein